MEIDILCWLWNLGTAFSILFLQLQIFQPCRFQLLENLCCLDSRSASITKLTAEETSFSIIFIGPRVTFPNWLQPSSIWNTLDKVWFPVLRKICRIIMFNIYCHGIFCSSYGFFKVICLHDTISLLRTPGSVNQRTSLNAKPNSIAFEITGARV